VLFALLGLHAALAALAPLLTRRIGRAWAPSLGITVDVRLDAFALLMVALVSGIGTLSSSTPTATSPSRATTSASSPGALTAFSGSMLGLVLADNLLVLFVFWELTRSRATCSSGSRIARRRPGTPPSRRC
jgi:formate hydrogenlyase subunit 3/multisubunit Na+/H+ antiporter MnhD subunit